MKVLALLLMFSIPSTPAISHCDKQKWQKLADEVELVLVAEVVDVKPAPGFWSGHIAAIQRVKFKAVRVLKGRLSSRELEVEYYVVKNSPLADKDQPRLSPETFKQGNQLILFLEPDPKRAEAYFTVDRNRGTTAADADTVKLLSP